MRFLPPWLRSSREQPAPPQLANKALSPDLQVKLLLADYYTALANAGVTTHDAARPWPIERAMREGYERVVWCFKAVATIGENVARHDVPFEVVEGTKDKVEVVEDHPIARLLNGQANPLEIGEVFLERLSAQLLLSKRGAFIEVVKSNAGTPVRLDLLPVSRTRIVPGYDALVDHYEITRLDGSTYNLDPDRVRWVRKPHPLDPFSGVTPLESAGLSLELDFFARLYNKSFMANDGRPGGIVGILPPPDQGAYGAGGMAPEDLQLLDARFGRGPTEAGKISVVEGQVSYVDTAATPRDSQYTSTTENSKVEILAAFGCPESLFNASGRTFDNAEQEAYNFWHLTMTAHLSRLASAFLPDCEPGQRPRFNLDAVEELQLPARQKRAEAREEFDKGLRSIKSYADMAGYGDEVADLPHTRALWIPAGRDPLPSREEDAAALGQGEPVDDDAGSPGGGGANNDQVPGAPVGQPATGASAQQDTGIIPAPPLTSGASTTSGPATATAGQPTEAKTLESDAVEVKDAAAWEPVEPPDSEAVTEAALYGALGALVPRWVDRAATRLTLPDVRRGTRHFAATRPDDNRLGTKALDAAYATNEQAWADDVDAATRPLIENAAVAAAAAWLAAASGQAVTPDTLPAAVAAAATTAAAAAMPALIAGAAWQARATARAISDVDSTGGTVDQAVTAVRDREQAIRGWAQNAAADAAGAAIEAGHTAAAQHWARITGNPVQRTWLARRDEKTRDTHRVAHGQRRGLQEAFRVGGSLLRYPRDPLGPPGETKNCRCRSAWRQRATGKFAAPQFNPARVQAS